jgi:hypothetical protein
LLGALGGVRQSLEQFQGGSQMVKRLDIRRAPHSLLSGKP